MNNLYGKAVSEYLRYGGFQWVKVNNELVNRTLNKSNSSLHNYFLEANLECPEELHDEHNDFPVAPERVNVNEEILSPFQLEIKVKCNIKVGVTNKLIPNLLPKRIMLFIIEI